MSDINFNFTYHRLDNLRHLTSVLSVNNDSVAIFGSYTGIFSQKKGKVVAEGAYLSGMLQGIKKGRDTIISITYRGLAQLFHDKKGVLLFQIIDKDRYKGLIFDSLRNTYWAYADRKIYIHGEKCDSIICKDGILKFGVKKIEKVVFDNKFGNIFFKGNINGDAKLTMYSVEKRCFSELYNNFNLNNALVYIHNNTLITIGQFGILFRKVLGPNKLSGPIYYKNIKDFNYKRAYDLQVCKDKMLVNTDKGLFRLTMPPDDSFATVADNPKFVDYRFLVKNQKDVLDAKDGDTIRVSQKSPKLQFDVINPYGNGKVKYRYRLSDSNTWMELNANELNLPSLVPDNYYKISLFAEDNVWKSDELVIYWYVEPRWWQTHNAIKAIWFVSVLGAILILVISILITRRLVVRGNRKKNLQMELELKSIYAQINPHFIFNSLNAALLMVSKNNMDEAYRHISKFSRLLRSYIRSSRNRIISLEEESTNLRNYIELQQVRFDGRFSYEIIASPGINLTEVNIPSLLLQPFVENAINHGLLPKKGNGNLKISFHLPAGENTLYCDIEDDGVGREQSRLENESRGKLEESYGDLLIKDLVRIFRVYEKMKIDIAYIDKVAPESGTTVRIKIKYLENGK